MRAGATGRFDRSEKRLPFPLGESWLRSWIDDYLLGRLGSAGLQPAGDAEARDAGCDASTFNLIGLPPTREQVAAFLGGRAAGCLGASGRPAFDSPQFGERWGRHWLDLARYADSNGLDENFLFREAWRYRNWVIAAVNADLPFDRFLTEQLAGDLLPFDSIEQRDRQRIAAGFLVVGPKVLLGNDPNERRMDIADEQIDTVGRAVLGADARLRPLPRS